MLSIIIGGIKQINLSGVLMKMLKEYLHTFGSIILKKPIDEKPVDMLKSLKHYFLTCKWFEVYDLIEFIANMEPAGKDFADRCNYALELEASAY